MKRILVDSSLASTRIGLVEDGELTELIYENEKSQSIVGNIYVGRIMSVHKGMQACFIDIGEEKNTYMQLKKGDIVQPNSHIVVQVQKDATGEKGAVVTNKLSFPGKFIILIPGDNGSVGISKKIENLAEREKIKEILKYLLPEGYGAIVRTEGMEKTVDDYQKEVKKLYEISEKVIQKSMYEKALSLIYKEDDVVLKSARDLFGVSIDEIVLNDKEQYEILKNEVKDRPERVVFYDGQVQMFENYMVESQAKKILNKKVWLKSGGFIVIEQTEACVVIDVNTGKYTGKKDFQETVFKTNLEAANEIAKQLRLRNLSGMIIVDFIDMKEEIKKELLAEVLEKAVKKDRIKTTVVGMTELGLMQITRKKIRVPILEKLTIGCSCCNGYGYVGNSEYISDLIEREVVSVFANTTFDEVIVRSNKRILKAFDLNDSTRKYRIEKKFSKKIELIEIETLEYGYYEVKGVAKNAKSQ